MATTNFDAQRKFATGLPGATEDIKWGADLVYSIGTKMFCVFLLEGSRIGGHTKSCSFKVDDDRTYLMGHSMGGAGTLYLAIKHPQRWAAIAALAPAAFAVDREGLSKIPKMPIMLVHGDMDTVVPVTVGRAWAEAQLIKYAYAYEQATHHRRPPESTPPLR